MNDQQLPPEWDWEPERLTLDQMLRRDLFPRWEWIIRAHPDPIEQENRLLAQMLLTGQIPEGETTMTKAVCDRCQTPMELDRSNLYGDMVQGLLYFVCPYCSHSEPLATSNIDILTGQWFGEPDK
ncbi:hypothetical protein [Effusibacillus pohliae]|uniref:hypothetical protein n=1 Tax=Effusibacillus pohliae TaxID=232270 RepID=UPI00035D8184|nr:hypothetical protein [Effusibacillus pohliae]